LSTGVLQEATINNNARIDSLNNFFINK